MEDVELIRRARRRGRVAISPLPAYCSARRWRENGLLKTTLHNWCSLGAYFLGVPPHTLAARYYRPAPVKKLFSDSQPGTESGR